MSRSGIVYLLGDSENEGVYKIGVTRGDVKRRIKKLQTGNSGEIYIVKLYEAKHPFFVEASLHRKYMPVQVMNEWYSLTLDEVINFYETCDGFERLADTLRDNPFFKYDKLK